MDPYTHDEAEQSSSTFRDTLPVIDINEFWKNYYRGVRYTADESGRFIIKPLKSHQDLGAYALAHGSGKDLDVLFLTADDLETEALLSNVFNSQRPNSVPSPDTSQSSNYPYTQPTQTPTN